MMNIAIFSFTKNGSCLNVRLMDILKQNNILSYTLPKYMIDDRMTALINLKETVEAHFTDDAIIFIGATGIDKEYFTICER